MSFESLLNKTGVRYIKTEDSANEYGEKKITYVESTSFSLSLQPKSDKEIIIEAGIVNVGSGDMTHKIYCSITTVILRGDRVLIDGIYYEILTSMNAAGRGHHLKLYVKRLQ